MMNCINCKDGKTKVIDTRLTHKNVIRRRRICLKCKYKFTTVEVVGKINRALKIKPKECFFCKSINNLELHHILPIKQNGLDVEGNLVYLCQECHLKTHKILSRQILINKISQKLEVNKDDKETDSKRNSE